MTHQLSRYQAEKLLNKLNQKRDSMNEKIKITFLQQSNDPTAQVVATFGLHIVSMDMFLSKMKLIKKKDGAIFVAPPSESYQDKVTGEKKYSNFYWFGENSSKYFQDECKKALQLYCEEKNISGLLPPPGGA